MGRIRSQFLTVYKDNLLSSQLLQQSETPRELLTFKLFKQKMG